MGIDPAAGTNRTTATISGARSLKTTDVQGAAASRPHRRPAAWGSWQHTIIRRIMNNQSLQRETASPEVDTMNEGLKSSLIVVLVLAGLCIAGVAVMFFGNLCPPQGPWPMPPWCKGSVAMPNISMPGIPAVFSPFYDTFGCLPKDCNSILEGEGRNFCTEVQAGTHVWHNCSNLYQNKGCVELCLSEKKPIDPATQEKIINDAVVIPSDISNITYPGFYNNPHPTTSIVVNPFCAISQDSIAYPIDFLGNYTFPEIANAPLPAEIKRSVGIMDVWLSQPNRSDNCLYSVPFAPMHEAIEKTLARAKSLGADQVSLTNYIAIANITGAEIDPPGKAAVSEDDMRFVANAADKMGLGVVLYLNLATTPEIDIPGWQVPNKDWLVTLIHNWEPFVLSQAKIAEETGIDAMMINQGDFSPWVGGFEETYQTEMLGLLQKVRQVYSGKVLISMTPLSGTDYARSSDLLSAVDGYLLTPRANVLQDATNKEVSVSNLKTLYLNSLSDLGGGLGRYKKPIYFRLALYSEKEALEKGWNEPMFCVSRGDDPCYQRKLQADFSVQAVAYEAMLEAVKEFHTTHSSVAAVDTYGYWFSDVILPDESFPQLGGTIRNKPAESIVLAWFKR